MNIKHHFILFLISLIPFYFYLQKPLLVGFDSYYFLGAVCQNTEFNAPIISNYLISALNCNITLIKTVLWLLMLSCSVTVAHLGELINKNKGWLAGILIYGSSYFITEFLKFEDDQFAFPILFLALYFFIKGLQQKNRSSQATGVGLALLSGLIWNGSILYLFAFATSYWIALLFSIIVCVFVLNILFGSILPGYPVAENNPGGIFGLGLILPHLLLLGYYLKQRILLKLILFWTIIVFLNAKFLLHLLPLLAISLMDYLSNSSKYVRLLVLFLVFGLILHTSIGISDLKPNEKHWEAIEIAQEYSNLTGKPLMNEFSWGYWMKFKGIKSSSKGGFKQQDFNGSIVLSFNSIKECKNISEWVYEC